MKPRVSIITINFNQLHHTMALLESLRCVTYPDVEVIVVDNASATDPTREIKSKFPNVHVIASAQNLGFAGGNNLGIRESTGKYLLFLNNDTEVDPGFLEPMVELFESNPKAGAASGKIIYHGSDNVIQYAGSTNVNPLTGRNSRIGFMQKDLGQHDQVRETDLAHGCAMMVPKHVIENVGLMPELFFLYYEEIDWCETIKRTGYRIFFVPGSKVFHKESMSVGKNSTLKTYYMNRNRLLYVRRNSYGSKKFMAILFFLFLAVPKNMMKHLVKREIEHVKSLWRACVWNAVHLPDGTNRFKITQGNPYRRPGLKVEGTASRG